MRNPANVNKHTELAEMCPSATKKVNGSNKNANLGSHLQINLYAGPGDDVSEEK